jgi:hypothetical protein
MRPGNKAVPTCHKHLSKVQGEIDFPFRQPAERRQASDPPETASKPPRSTLWIIDLGLGGQQFMICRDCIKGALSDSSPIAMEELTFRPGNFVTQDGTPGVVAEFFTVPVERIS